MKLELLYRAKRDGTRQEISSWLRRITLMAMLLPTAVAAAGSNIKQEFPRLAGIQIGATPFEGGLANADYQKQISRLDLAILGQSRKSVINDAKAIKGWNPNIKLGHYHNLVEMSRDRVGQPYYGAVNNKLDAERGPNNTNAHDWWLRDKDGTTVAHPSFPNRWRINISEYVKPDSNGDRYPEFKAKYDYNWVMNSPVWDIWYQDVVDYKPRFQNRGFIGDFSGGRINNTVELTAAWRRGHRSHWDEIRRLAPEKMILANLNWFKYQQATGKWDLKEYDQAIEGGLLEHIMNWDRSIEAEQGWETLRTIYYWSIGYLGQPKLLIFNVYGDPNDYKFFRYAFATCLMNDGYFDFSPTSKYNFGTVQWYDEFDLAGQSDTSWLGKAAAVPPTAPWSRGVYRRDFVNGVALVNPRGNGRVTVNIEAGFSRINGKQDRTINNGQPVTSLTLADGDGIVLIRTSGQPKPPIAPPKAPVLNPVT